jgi:glycosyltransferase involved in cell wall biosynthesis
MRVLYLNPFSQEVSGPDESLRTMLSGLIPRGIDAHIVLPRPGPQVPRYQALGATVHYAPLAVLRRNVSFATAAFPVSLARATAAIVSLARRVGAELIHTNMEVVLEGGLAARALGIPHVLHYRGNTLDQPRWVFDGLTALWSWEADHVYCISQATAGVFLRRDRGANVEVLYNPIDIAAFATATRSDEVRGALGGVAGTPLIGTVARIHPRKDLETFLRAAAQVAAREPRARFVIVGAAELPGEAEYLARLQGLAAQLNLGERVMFAGPRRDIPAVMRALDVFVLTSRHEGFGRVVAEAMAAGRPIVVTDEGAPPELVGRDRFGLCARPADPDDFARQILRLAQEPETAARLARAASERAAEFDAQVVADRVAARYESLVRLRQAA